MFGKCAKVENSAICEITKEDQGEANDEKSYHFSEWKYSQVVTEGSVACTIYGVREEWMQFAINLPLYLHIIDTCIVAYVHLEIQKC